MDVFVILCDVETRLNEGTPQFEIREESEIYCGVYKNLGDAVKALQARTKNILINPERSGYSYDQGIYYRLEGAFRESYYKYRIKKEEV